MRCLCHLPLPFWAAVTSYTFDAQSHICTWPSVDCLSLSSWAGLCSAPHKPTLRQGGPALKQRSTLSSNTMLTVLARQLGRQRALAETQQLAALLPAAQGLLASLQQLWTTDAACMQQIRPLSAATARPDPTAAAAAAAACRQQARWYARRAAKRTAAPHPDAIPANTVERFSEDEDEEVGVLRLPDDPKELAAINPQLARVLEMHWAMQQ